jgi:hypothetical protein
MTRMTRIAEIGSIERKSGVGVWNGNVVSILACRGWINGRGETLLISNLKFGFELHTEFEQKSSTNNLRHPRHPRLT